MEKQLLSLTVVACCTVALSACSQATAPPTRPQASAESVVDIAEPADSGSDSGVTFTMPEPGPFVPGPDVDIFKPCEEIPDEVFAELGLRKDPEGGDSFAPYSCHLLEPKVSESGRTLAIKTWDAPINFLIDNALYEEVAEIEQVPGILAREITLQTSGFCEALIETPRGTIGISATDQFNPEAHSTACESPQEIAQGLFWGKVNVSN